MAHLARAVTMGRTLSLAALLSALAAVAIARGPLAQLATPGSGGATASAPRAGLSSLPLSAQGPVSATLGAAQSAYRLSFTGAGWRAISPAQRLDTHFDHSGVTFSTGALRLGLHAEALESRAVLPIGAVRPTAHANRADYVHGALREWYANGPLGVEQGFTIARAPSGGQTARLAIAMKLSGNARASLSRDARTVTFSHGYAALRYGGLSVVDAGGRRLHSWLALDRGRLLIALDARGGRYPLRIDPLIQQGGKLTGAGEEGPGNLGASVALSADGNTALVGAPSDEIKGKEMLVGAAWVFTRTGSTWTQQGPKLRGEDQEGEAQFGVSVALSGDGNTALVGGIEDRSKKEAYGAAWVYTRTGGTWAQQGEKLTATTEETSGGRFGQSVALSGDGNTALVGAPFDTSEFGAAWVFKRSGSVWKQDGAKITGIADEAGEHARFGASVALSGDGATALIGGPFDEGAGKVGMAGAAWVFTDGGGGKWTQQGPKLAAAGVKPEADFGSSVALSGDGDTALVGIPGEGGAGAARAFARSSGAWKQQGGQLEPSDASAGASFGTSVALSADASTVLVGGPVDQPGALPTGAAWEFTRSGTSWSQQAKLKADGPVIEREFGAALALSADGRTAVIGGPLDEGDAGAAYAFVNPPPGPAPGTTPTPPSAVAPIATTPAAPVLGRVAQSHSRWRLGSALARLSATPKRKARPPIGTTFSFTLSEPARVRFTFTQQQAGRRVSGRCVAPSRSNRRRAACKRRLIAGTLALTGHAGADKVAFQGAISRAKKLKPGAYTVSITATSGGLSSSAKSLSFTIVK